jgi:hypothetical protein
LFAGCSSNSEKVSVTGAKEKIKTVDPEEQSIIELPAPNLELASKQLSDGFDSARRGPDNSEISTTVDAYGNKHDTRTFANNERISSVVVLTTSNGQQTATVYSKTGEARAA